jgi:5'-3' exonuclease
MILIDGSGLTYKTFHGNVKDVVQNNEFQYNYFKHLLLTAILWKIKLLGGSQQNRVVICSDSKPYWRYDYWESVKHQYFQDYYLTEKTKKEIDIDGWHYKGKRPKNDWSKQIWECHEEIVKFLTTSTQIVEIKVPGAEADCVMAVLAEHYSANEEIFVATGDKDMKQLLSNPRIHIYNDSPFKKPGAPDFIECEDPKRFLTELIYSGDAGDNIPNIKPKLGEKTATKYYNEPELLEENIALNPTIKFRLEVNRKMIDFSQIPENIRAAILQRYLDVRDLGGFDEMAIADYFIEHSLNDLQSRRQDFYLPPRAVTTRLNTYFNKKRDNSEYIQKLNEATLEEIFA